jgi:predicted DNA binding protein
VTFSILLSQADMETLIKRMTENIEVKVLANTTIEDFKSGFGFSGFTMPQITKRQMEIITYAIKRGYYDSPKKVSGQEIAKELGIEYATFYEHIRKIENKVIKHVFG